MDILISNQQSLVRVNRDRIGRIAREILALEGFAVDAPVELSLVFCDDDFIQKLNHDFRGHREPTDVLSFPMADPVADPAVRMLGDVVISMETARRQARLLGHPIALEVVFLLVHGILHLLGADHDSVTERHRMRRREEQICLLLAERRLLSGRRRLPATVIGRVDH